LPGLSGLLLILAMPAKLSGETDSAPIDAENLPK
jgi:hypothetical protein